MSDIEEETAKMSPKGSARDKWRKMGRREWVGERKRVTKRE